MGFSYALSQILASPPYVFAIIMSLLMAWVSDKYRTRWPVLVAQSVTAIVGLLIILYAKAPGVRYFGLYLAIFGTQANVPGTLAYGQSQTPDVRKKGVVAAAMITVGAAGGITGSTIFRSQDAPVRSIFSLPFVTPMHAHFSFRLVIRHYYICVMRWRMLYERVRPCLPVWLTVTSLFKAPLHTRQHLHLTHCKPI